MNYEDWKTRLAEWQSIQGEELKRRSILWHEVNPMAMRDYYRILSWLARKVADTSEEKVTIIN